MTASEDAGGESWSELKEEGNAAFKSGKFAEAVEVYDRALKAIKEDSDVSRGRNIMVVSSVIANADGMFQWFCSKSCSRVIGLQCLCCVLSSVIFWKLASKKSLTKWVCLQPDEWCSNRIRQRVC